MDLRQLRCFVEIASTGSYVVAARALAVSQPSLTKTIQALESKLGFRLFERRSRGVALTSLGEALYVRAQLILSEIDRTQSDLVALSQASGGEIQIGALRAAATARLPDVVIEFTRSFGGVRIWVDVDQNSELLLGVARGRYDFVVAVGEGDLDKHRLLFEPLWQDKLVIVTRASHPLQPHLARGDVPAERLSEQSWIMPESGTVYRSRLENYFYSVGVTPPSPALVCSQLHFIRAMLLKGDYVALLPAESIALECSAGLLAAHEIASEFLARSIGFVTRKDSVHTSACGAFMALLRKQTSLHPS